VKDKQTYLITGILHSLCFVLTGIGFIFAIIEKSSAVKIIFRCICAIGFAAVALLEFNIYTDFGIKFVCPFKKK